MSRMRKILVAYDGSPHSKQALNWAIDLSLLSEARVVAVKVFEGSQFLIASDTTAHKVVETLNVSAAKIRRCWTKPLQSAKTAASQ